MFRLRFVPDNTKIKFMRGRILGLVVSAVLSTASIILFFYPGLNYGIDFKGGISIEARTSGPADVSALRSKINGLGLGEAQLQSFGSDRDVLIRLERQPGGEEAQQKAVESVRATLLKDFPGTELRSVEAVGATVSGELFQSGMIALGLALVAMLIYIWFRFEWQFGVGAVTTLVLDVTKTVGFFALTGLEFNLTAIAALLTLI